MFSLVLKIGQDIKLERGSVLGFLIGSRSVVELIMS